MLFDLSEIRKTMDWANEPKFEPTRRFFFIIQRVKASVTPCLYQPLTRGDNTVSVAQSGTATPGATKQFLPPDRVFKRITHTHTHTHTYIYILDQLKAEITLYVHLHFVILLSEQREPKFAPPTHIQYIYMYIYISFYSLLSFFTPALADTFSLKFEWQHVASSFQDSPQYSGWS